MKHRCHAIGCEVSVPPKMLMCKRHWYMVPRALQRKIWATYVPGQETRKDPTDEYMAAHFKAVADVAEKEGREYYAKQCRAIARQYEKVKP